MKSAAASTASALSGGLVELVRSLSNWAWLLLEAEQWEATLSKAMEALTLSWTAMGPHSNQEVGNLLVAAVVALCGLATNVKDASTALDRASGGGSQEASSTAVDRCLSLFERANASGLCFRDDDPEGVPRCLDGVFALVSEGESSGDTYPITTP